MSRERLGTNGVWPRIPTFPDSPPRPAGVPRGDHIVLDEEDNRILDKVWAEVIGSPAAEAPTADVRSVPNGVADGRNGAVQRAVKRPRTTAPTSS